MIRLAINGFGRIGRMFVRQAKEEIAEGRIEIAAINDIADTATMAYLLQNDSSHGRYEGKVEKSNDCIIVDGRKIQVVHFAKPGVSWGYLGADIVVESTGRFANYEDKNGGAEDHLRGGARYVIISAPGKDEKGRIQTIVIGVNDNELDTEKYRVFSNASCTTNCLAPIAKVLHDNFGVLAGYMDTVHAYTNDQRILDQPHSDLRRARSAAINIIPTSTGASSAIGEVIKPLEGRLGGYALRVPVANVSIISLTALLSKEANAEQVNQALKEASSSLPEIIEYLEDEIVSSDLIGNTHSAVVDSKLTYSDGVLVNVKAWYDNECGYARRLVDLVELIRSEDIRIK